MYEVYLAGNRETLKTCPPQNQPECWQKNKNILDIANRLGITFSFFNVVESQLEQRRPPVTSPGHTLFCGPHGCL